ncbi:hypothetical protein SAMN04488077_1421 [Roseovarius tolerans]|uniref:NERD domain-containing protein n=1 Tax=Roseovarius tolerans TaxID=74031 RepID=A0A1H8JYJ8_9RHOB|nr:hypothetical protein [Roseovarius tolerans]SEN85770.1 hypothetical protein SAMN04488077_1421 [Roseovarius tolerans]
MGKSNSNLYLHGYETSDQPIEKASEPDDPQHWIGVFENAALDLETNLRIHDPFCLLARTASLCNVEGGVNAQGPQTIPLPALEVLQAMLIRKAGENAKLPVSWGNFKRLWKASDKLLDAFIRKQPRTGNDALSDLAHRSRVQTVHYRFNFDRDAVLVVVRKITARLDQKTQSKHDLENRLFSLLALMDLTVQRLQEFYRNVLEIYEAKERTAIVAGANYLCGKSPLAKRIWQRLNQSEVDDKTLQFLACQLSEVSHEWIYTFAPSDLSELDRDTLSKLSAKLGDEADGEFEHIFMNNPVWTKPFIEKEDGSYFIAASHIPLAFPFRIIETLLPDDSKTRDALSDARAEALEELITETVQTAMPSAKVYRSVIWTDPKDGKGYEHDVVAVLGNQVLIFEAKSGKIKEPARRGGIPSLKSTLKDLFVEPAEQSQRLQEYLNQYGINAKLRQKGSKEAVEIDLRKPKAVYRFGVTIEGLSTLTAGRRYFEDLDLIEITSPWAPSLSIGELMMIAKHLDSEVSFGHYLSRRYTIESLLDFVGDEQDLLSMYLTNGFCVLGDDPRKNTLVLVNADDMVRKPKTPVEDRRNCDVVGVELAPRWKAIAREVYGGHPIIDRHKFDILFTVLNMPPPMLMQLQRRIGRWKSGGGGSSKSGEHAKYIVADRQFAVILNYMDKRQLRTTQDITGWCRTMAMSVADDFEGTTDCVVVTLFKHSSTRTYDGISFFRLKPSSAGKLGATF